MTETRTGPLGCSNYDNLDSVSSVLVQSPENKVQLQGRAHAAGTAQVPPRGAGGQAGRHAGCWIRLLL